MSHHTDTARLLLPETEGMDLEKFFLVTGPSAQGRVSLSGQRQNHDARLAIIRDAAGRVQDRKRRH